MVCTNIRTMDGKRPVFIDHSESVFFFPYLHIRFVEFRAGATGAPEIEAPGATSAQDQANGRGDAAAEAAEAAEAESDAEIELDEDFLRRIREV
jgi:hypothetical protein